AANRQMWAGSLLCTIYTLNSRPQMATVRPRVMATPKRVTHAIGTIIRHDLMMIEEEIVTKVLGFLPDERSEKINLACAD
ncbi:electron transfer flavoprotein subunit alpha, partial [Rhizobium ruizarguesonis]